MINLIAMDVYDESPTLVTIWLTIIPKISILIFLLYFQSSILGGVVYNLNNLIYSSNLLVDLNSFKDFYNSSVNTISVPVTAVSTAGDVVSINVLKNLLLICSLLSLIIGAIVGLSQVRIKRLLAYSTINHIGFLLLALSIFSNSAIEAFIFYILQYTLTNLNIFIIILCFSYMYKIEIYNNYTHQNNTIINLDDIEYISSFKSFFYKNPLLSLSFSICLFSFAGVPPLIGFFAKQQVLYSSNSAGYFFISLVAILVSVISASYYLKIIKILHSGSNLPVSTTSITKKIKHRLNSKYNFLQINKIVTAQNFTTIHAFIISVLTLFILFFIFNPELLLNIIAIITSLILTS